MSSGRPARPSGVSATSPASISEPDVLMPGSAVYSGTKGAVNAISGVLANELAPRRIPARQQDAEHVDVELPAVVLLRHLLDRREGVDAGIPSRRPSPTC
jgi:hypothetical protein